MVQHCQYCGFTHGMHAPGCSYQGQYQQGQYQQVQHSSPWPAGAIDAAESRIMAKLREIEAKLDLMTKSKD